MSNLTLKIRQSNLSTKFPRFQVKVDPWKPSSIKSQSLITSSKSCIPLHDGEEKPIWNSWVRRIGSNPKDHLCLLPCHKLHPKGLFVVVGTTINSSHQIVRSFPPFHTHKNILTIMLKNLYFPVTPLIETPYTIRLAMSFLGKHTIKAWPSHTLFCNIFIHIGFQKKD